MLVLTRRVDEKVVLTDRATGEHIATVMVCGLRSGQVSLGFEAAQRVHILRDNVQRRGEEPKSGG
jgi:carbon storage regulator CsrA